MDMIFIFVLYMSPETDQLLNISLEYLIKLSFVFSFGYFNKTRLMVCIASHFFADSQKDINDLQLISV